VELVFLQDTSFPATSIRTDLDTLAATPIATATVIMIAIVDAGAGGPVNFLATGTRIRTHT
jgi:hypothetical protein